MLTKRRGKTARSSCRLGGAAPEREFGSSLLRSRTKRDGDGVLRDDVAAEPGGIEDLVGLPVEHEGQAEVGARSRHVEDPLDLLRRAMIVVVFHDRRRRFQEGARSSVSLSIPCGASFDPGKRNQPINRPKTSQDERDREAEGTRNDFMALLFRSRPSSRGRMSTPRR